MSWLYAQAHTSQKIQSICEMNEQQQNTFECSNLVRAEQKKKLFSPKGIKNGRTKSVSIDFHTKWQSKRINWVDAFRFDTNSISMTFQIRWASKTKRRKKIKRKYKRFLDSFSRV